MSHHIHNKVKNTLEHGSAVQGLPGMGCPFRSIASATKGEAIDLNAELDAKGNSCKNWKQLPFGAGAKVG